MGSQGRSGGGGGDGEDAWGSTYAARAAAAAVAATVALSAGASAKCSNVPADAPPRLEPLRFRRVSIVRTQKDTDERLRELGPLPLGPDTSGGSQDASVFVCPHAQHGKPCLGFGGSFTESAADSLRRVPKSQWDEVMRAYFDPKRGLGYTIGRVHMGSCDFSLGNWTCGDLKEGDHELRNFSLARYESSGIIPMIKQATAIAGVPLQLLASPWSPPEWMKTTKKFNGDGHLLPSCREVWALHYVKFVQEMANLGVPIWGVSVQNEPEAAQIWESCIYSAVEERDFIKGFLGPALQKHGLQEKKILFWDHNRDGMLERAAITYADPDAAKYIWGMCWHWYGDARYESWPSRHEVPFEDRQKDCAPIFELRARLGFENVRKVADLRPDKHLLFSEGCQELSGRTLEELMGHWKLGERYAMNIINDLNAGCEGFIDWNLCLDETGGPNHVGNTCSAPVIADGKTGRARYQPSFWYIGHFSRYIRPGAMRVACSTSRDALEVTAFLNPDGRLAVVVMNQSQQPERFWLKIAGDGTAPSSASLVDAPPRSIVTLVADDKVAGGSWMDWLPTSLRSLFAGAPILEPWQAAQQ